jgi:hypothetical protein
MTTKMGDAHGALTDMHGKENYDHDDSRASQMMQDPEAATKECAAGRQRGYNGLELLRLTITFRDRRSFTGQPVGSN